MSDTLVSIIIDNFNYARFLKGAILSALAQTYKHVEIIVVDDGSTDDSEAILREFEGRTKIIRKRNAGQPSAFNAGFEQAKGDWIAFLDSDDLLLPEAIDTALAARTEGCAKVQYPLEIIDLSGHPTGLLMPRAKLSSGQILSPYLRTGRYVTSPTSGNLFARSFLAQIMPIPESQWQLTGDGYINTAAPFFGAIAAIDKPLGLYRVHGESMTTVCRNGVINLKQMEKLLKHAEMEKHLLMQIAAERGFSLSPGAVDEHWMHLKLRISFYKLAPLPAPVRWRSLSRCAVAMLKSLATSDELSVARKLQYLLWTISVYALPYSLAQIPIRFAFEPSPQSRLSFALRRA